MIARLLGSLAERSRAARASRPMRGRVAIEMDDMVFCSSRSVVDVGVSTLSEIREIFVNTRKFAAVMFLICKV